MMQINFENGNLMLDMFECNWAEQKLLSNWDFINLYPLHEHDENESQVSEPTIDQKNKRKEWKRVAWVVSVFDEIEMLNSVMNGVGLYWVKLCSCTRTSVKLGVYHEQKEKDEFGFGSKSRSFQYPRLPYSPLPGAHMHLFVAKVTECPTVAQRRFRLKLTSLGDGWRAVIGWKPSTYIP